MDAHLVLSSPLDLAEAKSVGKLTLRKQVIYAGKFVKDDGKQRMEFNVTPQDLENWVIQFGRMKENGVQVPVPKEHTSDPEERRGTVVAATTGTDEKGRPSLFLDVEFVDADALEAFKASDVSIYVPPSFTDGKGNVYHRPIRHLALTDYPVIPDLSKWETLAASLSGEKTMSIRKLASSLGVKFDEDQSDESISAAITKAFSDLKSKNKEMKAAMNDKPSGDSSNPEEEEEEKKPAVAAGFITLARDNRENKINALVDNKHITGAAAKKLKEQFCSPQAISLALSADGTMDDNFESLLLALKENKVEDLTTQRSGAQALAALSFDKLDDNPLMKDAERRAAEAKA